LGLVHALAFNDHMRGIVRDGGIKASKLNGMVERSGLGREEFLALVDRISSRESEVDASVARLAERARALKVPLLSHDDRNHADRALYRSLGCSVSEFPMSATVAQDAVDHREATVFGAPNVLRGGSHIGCPSAETMAQEGLCSILASDYYYPSLLTAPFLLAASGVCDMPQAWDMVSKTPAAALALTDRGTISTGKRGDLILVDSAEAGPRLVATIVAGEIATISECWRLGFRQAA
jgi:alpha-D-ribose 1-methylphosphonate 5-triphosphate diphosphatase